MSAAGVSRSEAFFSGEDTASDEYAEMDEREDDDVADSTGRVALMVDGGRSLKLKSSSSGKDALFVANGGFSVSLVVSLVSNVSTGSQDADGSSIGGIVVKCGMFGEAGDNVGELEDICKGNGGGGASALALGA